MKKALKISGLVILLLIVGILLTPVLFKGKLLELTTEQINNNIRAKVAFQDFNLSIIKNFPSLSVTLDELSVVGVDRFEGDTLVYMKQLFADVNIMSVISGETIEISSIVLNTPILRGRILTDSTANWDITKPSGADTTASAPESGGGTTAFSLALKHFEIIDADILYDDKPGNIYSHISNFDFSLSGDFTERTTLLLTQTSIEKLSVKMDNISYLNKANLQLKANINADLENMKFTFMENTFRLNAFELGFDGWVSVPNENIDMDITFGVKSTEFKEILSLIPGVFMEGFENIKTDGKLAFSGAAKGRYAAEPEQYPAFNLLLSINDAMFQYPDLPGKVSNIQLNMTIDNPDGNLDHTVVDLNKLHVEFAENPFDISLMVKTPISDPDLKCGLFGTINLTKMKDFIPLDSTELAGIITANIEMEGKQSQIDNEQYEDFKALGNLKIANLLYKSNDLPQGATISEANIEFSPQYVTLHSFTSQIGKSDVSLNGKLENFIPYAMSDDTIVGVLHYSSNMLNIDEFMGEDSEEAVVATNTTTTIAGESTAVEIPGNIDFVLNTRIHTIIYDSIEIKNTSGVVTIKNSKADISKLRMNMLGGEVEISGEYNTQNIMKPTFDLLLGLKKVAIDETFKAFNTIQEIAPFVKHCDGLISMDLNFNGLLDNEMSPVLNTVNGTGKILTDNVKIEGSKLQNTISDTFKQEKYRVVNAKNLKINFSIENGNLTVAPFDLNFGGNTSTIYGSSNLDQSIDYTMAMAVPTENLGESATIINGLLSQASAFGLNAELGDKIDFDIKIKGTMTDPKISITPKGTSGKSGSLKSAAKDEFNKQKEALTKEVKKEVAKAKEEATQKIEETKAEVKKEATKKVEETKTEVKKEATKETQKKIKNLFK